MQQTTPPARPPQAAKPQPPAPPPGFQEGAIATMDGAALARILSDSRSTEFQKAKACQRAGELGAREAIPALAALLGDEHLSVYARYGLEPMPDPAAGEALRVGLGRLSGLRLIGVINSINKRRDAKAGPVLVKMLSGADPEVARAAAAALGSIGDEASVKELQTALGRTGGSVRLAVAGALLEAGERLLADGKRDQALALYSWLAGAGVPKPVRLGAMSAIVREETSVSRPR